MKEIKMKRYILFLLIITFFLNGCYLATFDVIEYPKENSIKKNTTVKISQFGKSIDWKNDEFTYVKSGKADYDVSFFYASGRDYDFSFWDVISIFSLMTIPTYATESQPVLMKLKEMGTNYESIKYIGRKKEDVLWWWPAFFPELFYFQMFGYPPFEANLSNYKDALISNIVHEINIREKLKLEEKKEQKKRAKEAEKFRKNLSEKFKKRTK